MRNSADIQWFPGHMAKARRKIAESLKLCDAVAEIVDSRIPVSSRNPELAGIIAAKPHILVLNKFDMADEKTTDAWVEYYAEQGIAAVPIDCRTGKGVERFKTAVKTLLKDKLERYREKGMSGKTLKIMVVGIPNVGKSTFINRLSKASKAITENRPGVTRSNQWFLVDKELELLDTPGVLWPKFDDRTVGEHLAFTGAVKDDIVDPEDLAVRLIECIKQNEMKKLTARYGIEYDEDSYEMLCSIAKKRGMMIKGGEADTLRAAKTLLEEFKNCKIGRISLEHPEM